MSDIQKESVGKVQTCLSKLGMPVKGQSREDSFIVIDTEFNYADKPMRIRVLLHDDNQIILIGIPYGVVPDEKRTVIHELISRLNPIFVICKCIIDLDTGMLALQSGMCISDNSLGEKEFEALLKQTLIDNYEFALLVREQLHSTCTPVEIIDKWHEEED